jgi:hypothetical protein
VTADFKKVAAAVSGMTIFLKAAPSTDNMSGALWSYRIITGRDGRLGFDFRIISEVGPVTGHGGEVYTDTHEFCSE